MVNGRSLSHSRSIKHDIEYYYSITLAWVTHVWCFIIITWIDRRWYYIWALLPLVITIITIYPLVQKAVVVVLLLLICVVPTNNMSMKNLFLIRTKREEGYDNDWQIRMQMRMDTLSLIDQSINHRVLLFRFEGCVRMLDC